MCITVCFPLLSKICFHGFARTTELFSFSASHSALGFLCFFLTFHIIKIRVKHDDMKELIKCSFSSQNNTVLEHVLVENIYYLGLLRSMLKEQNSLATFHSCMES